MDTRAVWELITQREATAAETAQALREQIAALGEQLVRVETELADLATTRTVLAALTGDQPISVPPDPSLTTVTYQQILAVFAAATAGMRARDVCLALGLGTAHNDTEGLRARLKRLVARQVLVESEPGLFTLAAAPSTQDGEADR